jgi:hypothetical protein
LASSRAKLQRATELRRQLDVLIADYLEENPYRFVTDVRPRGLGSDWDDYIEVAALPPDDIWGPVIGDVVHNLRSAVEHAAWDMALPSARAQKRDALNVTFPISMTEGQRFRRGLNLLRPEFHEVVRSVQPFVNPNTHHPLWMLHALWNDDKHRTIHTTGFCIGQKPNDGAVYGFDGWSYGTFDRTSASARTRLGSGSTGLRPVSEDHATQAYATRATFDVSVSASADEETAAPSYEGLPVRQMLCHIDECVRRNVIEQLAAVERRSVNATR